MKKYNMRNIMTNAWRIRRENNVSSPPRRSRGHKRGASPSKQRRKQHALS